ncbi:MAG: hypothetical protein H0Z35_11535 [Thermoanaerobacteraceae bacterium]|nr:hypothetical protein [Thermoanaerobacteraceae bacterium]
MRKLIAAILVIQMLVISGWGVYEARAVGDVSFVDEVTGIVVKQDTPENTLISYYELIKNGAYESAYCLLTRESREAVSVDMIKELVERTGMHGAELAKIFPAEVDGELALVPYIRTAYFNKESAILAISVMEIQDGHWCILKSIEHYSDEQLKKILTMAIEISDELGRDPLEEFNDYQQGQVQRQIKAMRQTYKRVLETIDNPIELNTTGNRVPNDSVHGGSGDVLDDSIHGGNE